MTSLFPKLQNEETSDHRDPVNVVGNHGAVGCRIGPSKYGIQDAPAATAVEFWTTALEKTSAFIQLGLVATDILTLTCHTLLVIS